MKTPKNEDDSKVGWGYRDYKTNLSSQLKLELSLAKVSVSPM